MISLSFSLLSLTIVYLIIGLFKPRWVLFGMKNPSRIWVISICLIAFMVAMTLYGEGHRRKQLAEAEAPPPETPTKKVNSAAPAKPAMTIAPSTTRVSPVLPATTIAPKIAPAKTTKTNDTAAVTSKP